MGILRALCIGGGYFACFHLEAWRRMSDVQVAAVCDRQVDRAEHAARQFDIPQAFADPLAAMDRCRPDFVDIITPPESHLELVEAAASRGIPVICQKPLAADLPTARRIVETAERAGVAFMVHENFRFQPWYREIHRLLEEGAIGRRLHGLHFRSRMGDGWGSDAYLQRQPYFRAMPRLLVHENGVHFIDVFRYLGGEIEEVYAILRRLNPEIAGEDCAVLTFQFAGGGVGVWDANRYNEPACPDPRYTFGELLVEADGGTIRLHSDGGLAIQPLGQPEREHPYTHEQRGFCGDCVFATQRHFVDRLRAKEPFETGGREYLRTLQVVEAAYRSAAEGRPMRMTNVAPPARPGPRVIDLSLTIDAAMPGVSVSPARMLQPDGWNATTLSLYSHCGTHVDAPRHFAENGSSVDGLPLEFCRGPAKVLDLTPVRPDEEIGVERLARWADTIGPGDRILIRTDWYLRYGTVAYREQAPRISLELARWLVEKGVRLVGVEPPSIGNLASPAELREVHQVLLHAGIIIVEGLAHLDDIGQAEVEFMAFPLKISEGDGSPVRAVAVESRAW